ncbi:MAG: T9SS type A sorting domain-containing protein, partial [Bacteroidia bacterium]
LVVSSVQEALQLGATAFDMMRSTQNCLGALKVRENLPADISQQASVAPTSLLLIPNPTQQFVNIITSEPYEQIELLDMAGRFVMIANDKTLDISALAEGIYFVRIQTINGQILLGKLVKN